MMTSDTIAAIATALTNSGIGIIRVSGNEAFDIVDLQISSYRIKVSAGNARMPYGVRKLSPPGSQPQG